MHYNLSNFSVLYTVNESELQWGTLIHIVNLSLCRMVGNDKWLEAYKDPVASLYTLTQCICLSDVQADGDWKLIIADLGTGTFNMKLKVYKGEGKVQYYVDCCELVLTSSWCGESAIMCGNCC